MEKPSKAPGSKTGEKSTTIQKIISAPDRIPSVYYYSPLTVRICIIVKAIVKFVLLLLLTYFLLPPFVIWLFPNLVLKTEPVVFWKMGTTQLPPDFVSTSIKAAGAGVQISYNEHEIQSLTTDTVLLVIDSERIHTPINQGVGIKVICRPTPYYNRRFTFQEYVSMVKICYLWIRMRKEDLQIIGLGRGTSANILLEAATQLSPKEYYFYEMHLEHPIFDYADIYDNNNWVKWMFIIPPVRHAIIDYVLNKYLLTFSCLANSITRLPSPKIKIYMNEQESVNENEQLSALRVNNKFKLLKGNYGASSVFWK